MSWLHVPCQALARTVLRQGKHGIHNCFFVMQCFKTFRILRVLSGGPPTGPCFLQGVLKAFLFWKKVIPGISEAPEDYRVCSRLFFSEKCPWKYLAHHGMEIFGTARITRARHGNIWPEHGTARHRASSKTCCPKSQWSLNW